MGHAHSLCFCTHYLTVLLDTHTHTHTCSSLSLAICLQDWFSTHLKHLVLELGRSGAGVMATDGSRMSTMSSQYLEEGVAEQPERAPLDLTE